MPERRYEECPECGHRHYDTYIGVYLACPEECHCQIQAHISEEDQ